MSTKYKLTEKQISRRSFMQWAGVLSATAALYGCGGDGDGPNEYDSVVSDQDDLVFDNELTTVMGTHPHNCGGRCPFKFYVKDYGTSKARVVKLTSAGDVAREGSLEKDESVENIQTRACVRGYAQLKRTYSPDRLKYPLIQTKTRGDVTGFKRISWDEALDRAADMIADAHSRYSSGELPYVPMLAGPPNALQSGQNFAGMFVTGFAEGAGTGLASYLGPTILPTGAPSIENELFGGIGSAGAVPILAGGNSVMNYEKSDFIIQWGADPAVKAPNMTFFLTKAKEAGVPIVTIDARYTDTAALLSSGFSEYNLPPFIQVRPQTDLAVTIAMAYVVYKKGWHDDAFLRANCYGFYPTQGTPLDSDGNPFPVVDAATYPGYLFEPVDMSFSKFLTPDKHPLAGMYAAGEEMHVPDGMSFVEYLDNLGVEKYKEVNDTEDLTGATPDNKMQAVMQWASELSGVSTGTIYNLADAMVHAGEVFLENGNNGGQKANNGMHHVWMIICLVAMCGQSFKPGGNLGVNASDGGSNPVAFGGTGLYYPNLAQGTSHPFLLTDPNQFVDMIFTGRDGRTKEQFYNDMKNIHGIELDPVDPKLEVDLVFGSYHITNSLNTCPNTNKAVKAFTAKIGGNYKIKNYVLYEQYMTPTALYADLILPVASHHEMSFFTTGQATYYQNKLIETMYDTKTDVDIDIALAEKLKNKGINISYSKGGKTDEQLLEEIWEEATVTGVDKPSFEQLKKQGYVKGTLSREAANPMTYLPFTSETGKLQFFSPFYNYRDGGVKNEVGNYRIYPAVRYVEPYQGYDQVLKEENVGVKGIAYTLQFTTKHARNRAHTVYDNVSMIRDQFDYPKRCAMNSVDAAKRGINDGDKVYIFNDWGCMHVGVSVSDRIREGVIELPHGVWFRAGDEDYDVWYDVDMGDSIGTKVVNSVTYYKYSIKIDIGGCENGLTHDKNYGSPKDPLCAQVGDNHFNGNLCEISKIHPDQL
jgi:anaerobic dimethyl sulfoxide reductase subunit A